MLALQAKLAHAAQAAGSGGAKLPCCSRRHVCSSCCG